MDITITIQSYIRAVQAIGFGKSILFIACLIVIVYLVSIFIVSPFLEQVRYEKNQLLVADTKLFDELSGIADSLNLKQEGTMEEKIKVGDIEISDNEGPTQVNIGSPGSKQIINQLRTINPNYNINKSKSNNDFILRVILTQSSGIWNQGTTFAIQAKFSGPYTKAKIVEGFPGAKFDVRINDNGESEEYFFSTTTAPLAEQSIILEIISNTDIDLINLAISPLTNN